MGCRLPPDPFLLFPELGSEFVAEVLRLEDMANFDLTFLEGGPLEPLDCLLLRPHLPEPEAGDQLLALLEWPIDHRPLSPGELAPRPLGARLESLAGEHDARLGQLFVELPHLGQHLLIR